jgi:hypothetical protein
VQRARGGWVELTIVWTMYALVAVAIFVTYARSPVSELYHVTGTGFAAGASRALVFLNYSTALAAIAVLLVLLDRLRTRVELVVAGAAIILCAAVFWPGVVTQSDLDARPVNAVAAIGVALALLLTLRVGGRELAARPDRMPGDLLRIAVGVLLVALALPWIAAELGFSLDGVPVLGTLYQTGELRTQPGDPVFHPAVHHGHHHGMDGILLVATAVVLSRLVPPMRSRLLRAVLGAYLALLGCYGAGNIANDFWLEQVTKRGWTLWEVPDVTTPKASTAWAVIVLAAIVLFVILVLPLIRSSPTTSAASRTTMPEV